MFDELERLHECMELRRLLSHYVEASGGNREVWQDRLQAMTGVGTRELVGLHGELLAGEWIEQNTGVATVLIRGAVPRCYRVTAAGLRALRAATSGQRLEDEDAAA